MTINYCYFVRVVGSDRQSAERHDEPVKPSRL